MARKKKTFQAGKAVRANARERIGQPPPARVLSEGKPTATRAGKHPEPVQKWLDRLAEGEGEL